MYDFRHFVCFKVRFLGRVVGDQGPVLLSYLHVRRVIVSRDTGTLNAVCSIRGCSD